MQTLWMLIVFMALSSCAVKPPAAESQLPFHLKISVPKPQDKSQLRWDFIGKMASADARAFIEDRKNAIAKLIEPNIDPYTGEDSFLDVCKAKNLPQPSQTETSEQLNLNLFFYSSDQYVLGLCPDLSHLLKTQYQILYCVRMKSLYIIRYFYDSNQWHTSELAACS